MSETGGGRSVKVSHTSCSGADNGCAFAKLERPGTPLRPRLLSGDGMRPVPLLGPDESDGQPAQSERQAKVPVIFAGCDNDFWKRMRRRLQHDGFTCSRVPNVETLLDAISGQKPPSVVVLGTGIDENGWTQLQVLDRIKSENPCMRVIYICEEYNPNSALIIAAGADDIVSQDRLQPKGLVERIEAVLMLHRPDMRTFTPDPVICEVIGGKVFPVDESRMDRVKETMGIFAKKYDRHMRRHFAVMNAILTAYKRHIGNNIIDVGCGTGHPMRQVIRDVLVPDFDAKPKLRELTKILSLDLEWKMLAQAQEGYGRLLEQEEDVLNDNLVMKFLLEDILKLNPDILKGVGFDMVDTIVATYFMHWANDKEGTVRKYAELLPPGGKFITVEEWPLVVTPGPHMPDELPEKIKRDAMPIERKVFYQMLRDHGFSEVQGGVMDLAIDDHHRMFGNVFERI
jgi:SAM-dependent methyltransferase/ActR/RegA family two-component response regulator